MKYQKNVQDIMFSRSETVSIAVSNKLILQTIIFFNKIIFNKMQAIFSTNNTLKALQTALQSHKIYSSIRSEANMKIFMETHVFAVWDFMLLLKDLQRRLTCVNKIWLPPASSNTARFINEIVVGQQTDVHQNGHDHISHFQLYLEAMEEVGANTSAIRSFVKNIRNGRSIQTEIRKKSIPRGCAEFVLNTYSSLDRPTPYVASQFFYGREDPIPQMFQQFLNHMGNNKKFDMLRYYLQRHVDIDGDEHGPLALKLMDELAAREDPNYELIQEAAVNAVTYRIKLWDSIYDRLQK